MNKFMADNDGFLDLDNEGENDSDLVKRLRKEVADRGKRLVAAEAEAKALREQRAEDTLKNLLTGVPDKYVNLAKRLQIEATPEAVAEFVKDYGDAWGHVDEQPSEEELTRRNDIERINRASNNAREPKGIEQPSDVDLANMSLSEFNKYLATVKNT